MSRTTNKKLLVIFLAAASLITGCMRAKPVQDTHGRETAENWETGREANADPDREITAVIEPAEEILQVEDGFFAVRCDGEYWFEEFLEQGGAADDSGVVGFLAGQLKLNGAVPDFSSAGFGCSTLAVENPDGDVLFGRNFDWEPCEAMVIMSTPEEGFSSVATVNMDFIRTGYGGEISELPEKVRSVLALYAPLDGMNENGFAVSVNMIQDSETISQDTGKPDITTTTAVRLLLNQAADVDTAVGLLEQYDMHSSMGVMIHFALADKNGRSAVVEYINNEMVVTDTPVVTNFYLSEGEKKGIGTAQSHTRYEILMDRIKEHKTMGPEGVRDSLDRVSKDNFDEFESTEWSIVFNLNSKEVRYYHREDFENSYLFRVENRQ